VRLRRLRRHKLGLFYRTVTWLPHSCHCSMVSLKKLYVILTVSSVSGSQQCLQINSLLLLCRTLSRSLLSPLRVSVTTFVASITHSTTSNSRKVKSLLLSADFCGVLSSSMLFVLSERSSVLSAGIFLMLSPCLTCVFQRINLLNS